jgi:hypothetical protein
MSNRKREDRDRPPDWREQAHHQAVAVIAKIKARDEAARKARDEAKARAVKRAMGTCNRANGP